MVPPGDLRGDPATGLLRKVDDLNLLLRKRHGADADGRPLFRVVNTSHLEEVVPPGWYEPHGVFSVPVETIRKIPKYHGILPLNTWIIERRMAETTSDRPDLQTNDDHLYQSIYIFLNERLEPLPIDEEIVRVAIEMNMNPAPVERKNVVGTDEHYDVVDREIADVQENARPWLAGQLAEGSAVFVDSTKVKQ